MNRGAITDYIDVAQIVLYVFWIFFAGLIVYLRREDKREGYPLESDRSGARVTVRGFPGLPAPKTFLLADGSTVLAPRVEHDTRPILAKPIGDYLGAPLKPTGNPMLDAVGPAAYAERATHPDYTSEGLPMIAPLRVAKEFSISPKDPDPRGMEVYGADLEVAGKVTDLWIDRAEPQIRYLEVDIGTRHVLLPINFAKIDGRWRIVNVKSIQSSQFATVPTLDDPNQITRREEDQILAYYASGHLYGYPGRAEPFI
jgi:photosynthetic reaction center H subunit